MGYVVVVFCLMNTAALLAVGWYLRECWRDLPGYVGTAIQDEVRKQDDRIEKRLAKREGTVGEREGELPQMDGAMVAGRRYRRGNAS